MKPPSKSSTSDSIQKTLDTLKTRRLHKKVHIHIPKKYQECEIASAKNVLATTMANIRRTPRGKESTRIVPTLIKESFYE